MDQTLLPVVKTLRRFLPCCLSLSLSFSFCFFFSSIRGQLHQQCCEEWTLVSEETQAKMARMAAAAAWGLGKARKKKDRLFLEGVEVGIVFDYSKNLGIL